MAHLGALTDAGIVGRTDVGDRTWRFEMRNLAMGQNPHPHFMCIACNTVQCLPRESVRIAPEFGRPVIEVQVEGRCANCA